MMIYFISDLHLGLPNYDESLVRERKVIQWLEYISTDATEIYLMGDIFEFWWEWKSVVPKYFVRFLGKLAEISDRGIKIYYFVGNHDIWAGNYFNKEMNIEIYKNPVVKTINDKIFYLAHGDGLGPADKGYKFLKKIFTNKVLQWLTANLLHPEVLFALARSISYKRESLKKNPKFKHNEEWLIQHSQEVSKFEQIDFFVFGHRHIPFEYQINEHSKVVVLGDWLKNYTYARFDGNNLELKKFDF